MTFVYTIQRDGSIKKKEHSKPSYLIWPSCEVHPFYLPFSAWGFAASFFAYLSAGLASGVLIEVTVKASCSDGIRNWLLKDAAGMAGGVFGAGFLGKLPDLNPRATRILATCLLGLAQIIDCSSVYWIGSCSEGSWLARFILLAVVGGILRNLSAIIGAAAKVHQLTHLTRVNCIGEMTSRATTQSMFAGLLGTLSSVVFFEFVDTQLFTFFSLGFSVIAVFCIWKACRYAYSPKLDTRRLIRMSKQCLSPEDYLAKEGIFYKSNGAVLEEGELPNEVNVSQMIEGIENGSLCFRIKDILHIWLVRSNIPQRKRLANLLKTLDSPFSISLFEELGWEIDEGVGEKMLEIHIEK